MRAIQDRLLPDFVTVRKAVQTMVSGTRRPIFEYRIVQTGVKARFNPAGTSLNRNVLGQTPRRSFRLFLNATDLEENDEVVNESTGAVYLVTEVRNFFDHHMEVVLEEKKS